MSASSIADSRIYRELHKFGGSSLADVKSYQRVAKIIADYSLPGDLIVVSAAGNTTNQLIKWLTLSQSNHMLAKQVQCNLSRYQIELISGLLSSIDAKKLLSAFIYDLERITTLLLYSITENIYAEVVGHGEIWSARLMAALLSQLNIEAQWLDAREFLRAERAVQPKINEKLSLSLFQKFLKKHLTRRLVVTGFICRNQAGETVLLGRNGSDYSATQIGALAHVTRITMWSNVAGIYTADPHKVKDAFLLPLLRLDEANELARLATPVLHARTLQPLLDRNINLILRCSYQPEQGFTRIEQVLNSDNRAKIITSHNDICLIELTISQKINFFLARKKIEELLKKKQIKPLAVRVDLNRRLLQLCYTSEIAGSVFSFLEHISFSTYLKLRKNLSMIALVGAGIAKNILYSNYFYQQLKYYSIELFWQSENGISLVAVLRSQLEDKILQELHNSIFCIEKNIELILVGNKNKNLCWLNFFSKKHFNTLR